MLKDIIKTYFKSCNGDAFKHAYCSGLMANN